MKPICFESIVDLLEEGFYVRHNTINQKCYIVHESDIHKPLFYVTFNQYLKLIDLRKKQNFLMIAEYYSFELIF